MALNILVDPLILAENTISSNNKNNDSLLNTLQYRSKTIRAETTIENNIDKPKKDISYTFLFWKFKTQIIWKNVILMSYLHLAALYGLFLILTGHVKLSSWIIIYIYKVIGMMGITAGAHRLWAHKAYKAQWPLRVLLVILNSISLQNCVYEWVRDHRVHHKFVDTDADPHSTGRGFFFSHVGWLLMKKHPDVIEKGKTVDMTDLQADKVVMFQKRYYILLAPLFGLVIPLYSFLLLGESLTAAWYVGVIYTYAIALNSTWCVNSVAHYWGSKPYDKCIRPTNNLFVASLTYGEGFHNYHHVFPWDYKTAELGSYTLNFSAAFIDFMARIGWAYDLKTVSEEMILKRAKRTGDGTTDFSNLAVLYQQSTESDEDQHHHHNHHHHNEPLIWGWDDKDLDEDLKEDALIINKIE